MGAPVVHFEIMGGSGKQLEQFYSKLFDWTINSNNPMNYGVVDGCGSIRGGVGPPHDGNARVTVYVGVLDLSAALANAEKLGGKIVLPPSEIPGSGTIAMFSDPAGNVTGLFKI